MIGAGSLVYNFFGVIVFLMMCKKFSFFAVFFLSISSLNLLSGGPASDENSSDKRLDSPCVFVVGALFPLPGKSPEGHPTFRIASRLAGSPLQGVTPSREQTVFGRCSVVYVPTGLRSPEDELKRAARLLAIQQQPAPAPQPQKESSR